MKPAELELTDSAERSPALNVTCPRAGWGGSICCHGDVSLRLSFQVYLPVQVSLKPQVPPRAAGLWCEIRVTVTALKY